MNRPSPIDLLPIAVRTRELLSRAGMTLESHRATFEWWQPAEETEAKRRDYAMVDPEALVFRFSRKMLGLDARHRDGVIAHEVGHVVAWHRHRDGSERGADRAARRDLGITISYDKRYGGKGLQMAENPGDDKWAELRAENRRLRAERAARVQTLLAMISAAVDPRTSLPTVAIRGEGYGKPMMALVSGELADRAAGRYRVTFFGPDGPHGHNTRSSFEAIAEEIDSSMSPPFTVMTEAEVMAWTTSPEFEVGSRIVAFVQAENQLRWFASRAGRGDWAQEKIREANEVGHTRTIPDLDRALAIMYEAIRSLPEPNPRIAGFVPNPPAWVTAALAQGYETLEHTAPSRWMPALTRVSARGGKLSAALAEFGCGVYGCVMPTLDPKVVLKVTSDETETAFAADLAPTLVAPICVTYHMVADLEGVYRDGFQVSLLWREAADQVGKLRDVLGRRAEKLIDDQHEAAQIAYRAIDKRQSEQMRRARISHWLEMCERMATQVEIPELRALGAGLVEVYEKQRIVFGDVHAGNLGVVTRDGVQSWVITDPGHVAVVEDLW